MSRLQGDRESRVRGIRHSVAKDYSALAVVIHRRCLLAFANDAQAIPDLLEGLRLRARDCKDKKVGQGIMEAVTFLAEQLPQHMESGDRVHETKEEKVQREFEELRQRLLLEHESATVVTP